MDLFLDVVEGEHLVEEHQAGVGDAELVGGERGQAFDLADDVVGEESDGASGEGWQAREARWGVAAEGGFELGEDVALEGAAFALFLHRDRRPAGDDLLVRLDADEGIAAHVLAALDGLEQEGFGLVVGDAEEGRDGGFQVGGDGAVDGHQGVFAAEAKELAGGWSGWRCGGHGVLTMVLGAACRY